MNGRVFFLVTAAVVIAAEWISPAAAGPLPPPPPVVPQAIFDATVEAGVDPKAGFPAVIVDDLLENTSADANLSFTQLIFGTSTTGSGSASAEPFTVSLATAEASASTDGLETKAFATALVDYTVIQTVPTPVPVTSVPTDVLGLVSTHVFVSDPSLENGVAIASVQFSGHLPIASAETECSLGGTFGNGECTPDVAQPYNVIVGIIPGEIQQVFLSAEVNLGGVPAMGTAKGDANVDPTITIDPSFPFKDDFTLVFSPNLNPPAQATIPEPPSLGLLLGGLGLVAVIRRRRRLDGMTPA